MSVIAQASRIRPDGSSSFGFCSPDELLRATGASLDAAIAAVEAPLPERDRVSFLQANLCDTHGRVLHTLARLEHFSQLLGVAHAREGGVELGALKQSLFHTAAPDSQGLGWTLTTGTNGTLLLLRHLVYRELALLEGNNPPFRRKQDLAAHFHVNRTSIFKWERTLIQCGFATEDSPDETLRITPLGLATDAILSGSNGAVISSLVEANEYSELHLPDSGEREKLLGLIGQMRKLGKAAIALHTGFSDASVAGALKVLTSLPHLWTTLRLLRLLPEELSTNQGVAAAMGINRTTFYKHSRALAAEGCVECTGDRPTITSFGRQALFAVDLFLSREKAEIA